MRKMGVATTLEAGVIAHYVLGDPNANAFVGGAALTSDFIKNRPDVAKRFTAAWGKAVDLINNNPTEARKHLLKNTFTPDDVCRYRPDDPLLHGQGPDGQGQGRLPEVHRLLGEDRHARKVGRRHQLPQGLLIHMADGALLTRTVGGAPIGAPLAASAAAPHVTVRGLTKRFGKASIYERFDLDIPRGKLVSVFGPNGCGKSTLINIIAGLIPPDAGEILFDGKPLRAIKFGYVFQNYREALFPWLRSFDNIDYPLKLMKLPKAERRARVEKLVSPISASRSTSTAIPTRCPAASSSWSRSCGRWWSSRKSCSSTSRSRRSTTR